MTQYAKLKNKAKRAFIKRQYTQALTLLSLAHTFNTNSKESLQLNVLCALADMAIEHEEEARALFEYYHIISKKNEQEAQRLNCSFPLSTAVRTRLELATPCVTGMYSNQLNYRTSCRVCITAFFRFACAKLLLFPHSRKFFSKKFAFYPIFL